MGMLKIKPNDYKMPIEMRKEVMQNVCDFILDLMNKSENAVAGFNVHLHSKKPTYLYALYDDKMEKVNGFGHFQGSERISVKLHKVEMQKIFDELRGAGYFIFRIAYPDGTVNYKISKKPFYGRYDCYSKEYCKVFMENID